MIIPVNELPVETLQRIAEDFASRDGTDYGERECSLEEKTRQLMAQIRAGAVLLSFDDATETLNVISAEEYRAHQQTSAKQAHSAGDDPL